MLLASIFEDMEMWGEKERPAAPSTSAIEELNASIASKELIAVFVIP